MNRRLFAAALAVAAACASLPASADDLSYQGFVDSDKRIKCLYGYAASKTGDHAAALKIFNDCIERWNDVYSMIWLAQMYEAGSGVPRDLGKAAAMIRRGAEQPDGTAYVSLARYHWGVALWEGNGVERDPAQARLWLERAAAEGETDASDYLRQHLD
ncbi:tetratricopeptide repeat protein [Pseudomonas sp. GCM10022188]|uniref:tetratricopeptide repeat protein n=1 Tax=Pseudomonas TaxID=286 RepID=UPI001E44DB35|nr:sel1 repeat family protein [Pseudomonas oryzagri]MCC6075806.1 sel1 repeat family protein [Pseudomonas oryzagri]